MRTPEIDGLTDPNCGDNGRIEVGSPLTASRWDNPWSRSENILEAEAEDACASCLQGRALSSPKCEQ
jgi:hypothetical protein